MRLPASLRCALYAAAGVLFASGVTRSTNASWMRVHGGAAMVVLLLVGAVMALHAAAGWRERKNRVSGAVLGAMLALLTATGYLLYYSGNEAGREAASLAHWLLGCALPIFLLCHIWLGRRSSAKA